MLWYFNEIFDGLNRVSLSAARRNHIAGLLNYTALLCSL